MSADVLQLRDPWQFVADASDRVTEFVAGLPDGDDGYELAAESVRELHQAAALLHQAGEILKRTWDREVPRYDDWSRAEERGD